MASGTDPATPGTTGGPATETAPASIADTDASASSAPSQHSGGTGTNTENGGRDKDATPVSTRGQGMTPAEELEFLRHFVDMK